MDSDYILIPTLCVSIILTLLQSCTDTVEISRDVDRVLCVVHLFFGALRWHLKVTHAVEACIFDFRSQVFLSMQSALPLLIFIEGLSMILTHCNTRLDIPLGLGYQGITRKHKI